MQRQRLSLISIWYRTLAFEALLTVAELLEWAKCHDAAGRVRELAGRIG